MVRRRAVPGRADRWRRVLLFTALASLGLLATAPVVGHHLVVGDLLLERAVAALGDICQAALYRLLAPVHSLAHALLVGGFAYATWERARAARRLGRTLAGVGGHAPSIGSATWVAAADAGVTPDAIVLVHGLGVPALTAGWFRPQIYLAAELEQQLTVAQLAAVIAHEGAHARRRDPLRLSLLRFVACWFFWLPALRRLTDDIADETELLADDAAARTPLALAAAIVTLAQWPAHGGAPALDAAGGAVGFAGPLAGTVSRGEVRDVTERRVLRLVGVAPAPHSHVGWRSLAAAVAALLLSWMAGAAVARPLHEGPSGAMSASSTCMPNHAAHHWLHFFCPPSHHRAALAAGPTIAHVAD